MNRHPEAPHSTRRTRRHRRIAVLGCAAVVLAACGSDDSGNTAASATPGPTTAQGEDGTSAPSADAFPVTIEHALGETVIPAEPTRVVALGVTDHDALLALGITPVVVTNWRGTPYHPWNADRLEGEAPVEITDPAAGIDFEAIAAARPDLIVSLWGELDQAAYDQLSAIAPTIAQSGDFPPFGAPWDVNQRIAGRALGHTAEAEAVIADVERQIAESRAAHPELEGRSITIAADFADGALYITPPSDARYTLLAQLGMDTAPAGLAGVDTLSFEEVDRLNAVDAVVWLTLPEATIGTNELYLAQPVHVEGRDIFPTSDSELGLALTYGTALSIPYTLEHLVPLLSAAVDGDPATTGTD